LTHKISLINYFSIFVLGTLVVQCFIFVIKKSWLIHLELWACGKYCWLIGLHIVSLGTHGLQCFFFFLDAKFLLNEVEDVNLFDYWWWIEMQIFFIGIHGVHCLISFVMQNSCLQQFKILSLWEYCWSIEMQNVFLGLYVEHCLRYFSMKKTFAWDSWNFELVEIFLNNLIAVFFLRHAECAMSVFFLDGNFFLVAVGMLSLWKYSWSIELQNISWAGMVCSVCFLSWCKLLKAVRILSLYKYCSSIEFGEHFPRHAWWELSVFFPDGKF